MNNVVLHIVLSSFCVFLVAGCGRAGTTAQARPATEPPLGTEIVHPVDGAIMVYVPAGEFVMGLDEADAKIVAGDLGFEDVETLWAWEAYPKRKVNVDGYFIDKYEVMVEQWRRFAKANPASKPLRLMDANTAPLLPTAEVSWSQAKQYAAWAGKALPSEAQWEKAARGSDGRLYPWGNEPPTPGHGNFGERGKLPALYVEVGSYPKGASPCGAMDMLGNQYEWVSEWKEPYPGNPRAQKMIDDSGTKYVCLRGGSWYHGWISFYAAKRFGLLPDETYYHVSFRTVWVPAAGYFQSEAFARDKAAVPKRKAEIDKMRLDRDRQKAKGNSLRAREKALF